MHRIAVLFLATFAATSVAQQPSPHPAPAPLQVPNPHYVTLQLTQDVNAPARTVWARVGKYCDIGKWAFPECKLLAGDGGFASVRSIVNEVLVGKTGHSYTFSKQGKVVTPLGYDPDYDWTVPEAVNGNGQMAGWAASSPRPICPRAPPPPLPSPTSPPSAWTAG